MVVFDDRSWLPRWAMADEMMEEAAAAERREGPPAIPRESSAG
jgi:hypothetical protein